MPRVSDAEIERIRRETDLTALVRSRGVALRKDGSEGFSGACPFHADAQAAFMVDAKKGLFACKGCGVAGNAIKFVEKFDGVSFRHAFELLSDGPAAFSPPAQARERGIGPTDMPLKKATVPRLANPFANLVETLVAEAAAPDDGSQHSRKAQTDAVLMRLVVGYYHDQLLSTPSALSYLRGRGLCHDEALRGFRLGLSNRTLGLRIPAMNRKEGKAIRTRLYQLGLYRKNGREHMNGRIVLPIPGPDGRTALYGHLLTKPNPGAPKHLYLPCPPTGIWNAQALDPGEVILCEAPFDALTFWVNGFKNVTFIYGTEPFPDSMCATLHSRGVTCVRLAYPADAAANRAAARDAQRLTACGMQVFRVKFPWGLDANGYARKVQPPGKALRMLLNAAEWVGNAADKRAPLVAPEHPRAAGPTPAAFEALGVSSVADQVTPPASNPPAAAAPTFSFQRLGDYHFLRLESREYRVGGLSKNSGLDVLKVTVRLKYGEAFHLDSFDMARDGERRRFVARAAEETRLEQERVKRDLGKLLLAIKQAQEERIAAAMACLGDKQSSREMHPDERREALALLKAPDLIGRIGEAFATCGLVGEEANGLVAYLACTSRKLARPLAVIIQSTSAAGKSTLMEAVLAMFPEEERVKYSAMTGQSLYYLGDRDLQHKILAIIEEEGAAKASYALKLLQSEGELTIASTGKDPHTGRMETQEYRVEGPVMIFLTTTAVAIDEELLNRCLVLTVDESREQTARIHALQRQTRTLEGLRLKKQRQKTLCVLRNAQRLLEPIDVVNPWADQLTFTAERMRTRRDHEKYLTLIDAIALLHQHQRGRSQMTEGAGRRAETGGDLTSELRSPASDSGSYIRVTREDIALANRLATQLLGHAYDELPPQTRHAHEAVKAIVRERMKADNVDQHRALFSRREVRDRLGWGATQIRAHLERLRDMECIAARYGRPGSPFQYELLTDCREHAATAALNLLDVEKLRACNAEAPPCPIAPEGRPQPVGANGNLSAGCRPPARQVQSLEPQGITANLSGNPQRTSGAAAIQGIVSIESEVHSA